MTWRAVRDHTHLNSWMILFLWVVLLLDCIVVHGCIRKEQQEAIKVSKDVQQQVREVKDAYNDYKRSIHYGRVKK